MFIICNFIFLVLGAIAFAIGVWGIVVGTDYDVITGSETVSFAALLLVGGIVTFIVASIGIIGACAMWRPLLLIYIIALVVIIILEFVAAILAFVFVDTISDEVRERMEDAIVDYRFNRTSEGFDNDVNTAVDNVQETVECCGVDNATDWLRLNPTVFRLNGNEPPPSCVCGLNDGGCRDYGTYNAWEDGCAQKLQDNLEAVGIAVGVLSIVFVVIEILLLAMAFGLICCIYSTHRQSVV
jgi:hypothetical protein